MRPKRRLDRPPLPRCAAAAPPRPRAGWLGAFAAWLAMGLAASAAAAPLRLAIAELPAFAPVLVAEAEGYFEAEGLDLRVIRCVNGRRCLKHLLDGEAQLATVADTPIVLASFTRRDFTVVATFATSTAESKFITRADTGIRNPADLKGKRIGIVKGTTGHFFAERYLTYYGIDRSQVTLVPLDPTDPAGALARREVDAVCAYDPTAYKARRLLGAQAVRLPQPSVFDASFNLVASTAGAGVSDADLTKLLRALQRAEKLIRAEPGRTRELVARRLGLEQALIDSSWDDYHYALTLDQALMSTLEAQARWAQREGLGDGGQAPDFLDLVRPEPLRALERRAVTLVK